MFQDFLIIKQKMYATNFFNIANVKERAFHYVSKEWKKKYLIQIMALSLLKANNTPSALNINYTWRFWAYICLRTCHEQHTWRLITDQKLCIRQLFELFRHKKFYEKLELCKWKMLKKKIYSKRDFFQKLTI